MLHRVVSGCWTYALSHGTSHWHCGVNLRGMNIDPLIVDTRTFASLGGLSFWGFGLHLKWIPSCILETVHLVHANVSRAVVRQIPDGVLSTAFYGDTNRFGTLSTRPINHIAGWRSTCLSADTRADTFFSFDQRAQRKDGEQKTHLHPHQALSC